MPSGPDPSRILVIACGALAHDLVRIREINHWDHLDIQCLPAELHNRPQLIAQAVQKKIHENRSRYVNMFVAYSDCGTGGRLDQVLEDEGVERLPGAHCYEMFSGARRFNELHEAEFGTFYLTDFLASHFERLIVKGLGMDRYPELKEQYFGNYRKLVYLAQKDDASLDRLARQASEYLGLEYQRVRTGDGQLTSALSVQIGGSMENPEAVHRQLSTDMD